jgi:hypothetical protein
MIDWFSHTSKVPNVFFSIKTNNKSLKLQSYNCLPDPGAVENRGPPKRPRPPPPNPAGGGVKDPDPIPRPAEALKKAKYSSKNLVKLIVM